MLSNGVPMKQIQEWLGHADFSTTANIYSHLDYKTKQNSANTISNVFNFISKKEEDKTNEIDKTKELEEKIRDWAVADSAIIIICGPILDRRPKTIGPNRVAVPKRFFKVVLSPYVKPMRAIGFLFNNQMAVEPLSTYSVPVDRVEQLTGMDFFAPLPDEIENKIEAESDYRKWPH